MDPSALPHWPALMDTPTACAYLSMGEGSLKLLAGRRNIAPVDFGGLALVRWRKRDLDALVDSLPPRGGTLASPAPVADLEAEALARVQRRRRG